MAQPRYHRSSSWNNFFKISQKEREAFMQKIYDGNKIDVGLKPQSLATTNATGQYFNMKEWRRAAFLCNVAAMSAGNTATFQIMEAKDAAGTDAQVLTNAAAAITANTKVKSASITLTSTAAGTTFTVNGVTFEAETSTTTPAPAVARRTFSMSGNDAADATALAACINDETYGVAGVLATVDSNVIYLTATEPGDNYVTVSVSAEVAATVEADAVVEIDSDMMSTNDEYTHIAIRATTVGTVICSAMLVRNEGRFSPDQYVAAAKTNVSA
jgi:hypothetical protein